MIKLTEEEIKNLSRQERYNYYEKLRNYEWSKLTWEEKKDSILSDYEFIINKRGIEYITLEESIEFALKNEPNERSNYVTPLVEQYFKRLENEKFTFFWETSSPFSQWHKSKFLASTCLIQGVCLDNLKRKDVLKDKFPLITQEYSSAEQFMMYHKAIVFLDINIAEEIMSTNDVRKIKNLGRKVENYDGKVWEYYRSNIVYEGNKAKFTQNEELKQALFSTKGTTLVEAAPNDIIWGIGLSEDDTRSLKRETWKGKNLLGEILTNIRVELLGEY
ncbi:NADAR family protein [Marivirga sp. S37H4]|uniref:NADAR family protein n=1 Tax=Marivirga aurantiaca TaxID=2802615 RepID=A0A934WXL4_9BACT|nr:NADAR family protein [Marivirga aurantiaca]MBK6264771.1 NADAR family protein [Marivirga aurantiaca]